MCIRDRFIAEIEKQFGFDKPAHERFFIMLKNYLSFDLGHSYFRDVPVLKLIKERLPVSISLGLWTVSYTHLDVYKRQDKNTYRFLLRKEARFHDGSKLTAKDVAFSLNILKTKGHPVIRQELRDMESAVAEADDVVRVTLRPKHSRGAAMMVAGQPIVIEAYYPTHKFDETTMEAPLGSGAYKVGAFDQGRYISFQRVADYWACLLYTSRCV